MFYSETLLISLLVNSNVLVVIKARLTSVWRRNAMLLLSNSKIRTLGSHWVSNILEVLPFGFLWGHYDHAGFAGQCEQWRWGQRCSWALELLGNVARSSVNRDQQQYVVVVCMGLVLSMRICTLFSIPCQPPNCLQRDAGQFLNLFCRFASLLWLVKCQSILRRMGIAKGASRIDGYRGYAMWWCRYKKCCCEFPCCAVANDSKDFLTFYLIIWIWYVTMAGKIMEYNIAWRMNCGGR